ncbi:class I adenylate-forming enzyme family protein [Microtetraspora glauca]|uniref:AMP-binding protein n=1 Tax=Microtetraspora glauca TaxID=1996 RepID=A0ABV3GRV7_MICGL
MNAATHIWRHAMTSPDSLALREAQRSWTYAQLRDDIAETAYELTDRGVGRGDRVLIVVPTSAEFVHVYYAVLSLGATAVTVNTLSTSRELGYFIDDAGCTLAVGWSETAEPITSAAERNGIPVWVLAPGDADPREPAAGVPDPAEVEPEHAAVLLYTSGTTGRPKGAVLTHHNLLVTGEMFTEALPLTGDDRMGTALPLFHVFGQAAVMASIYNAGGSFSVLRPFHGARLLEMAANHRLTVLAGVPTMWNEMLHAETDLGVEDFADLRVACSGGAAMPLQVARAFRERFGATVLDGYGLSETTGAATFNEIDGARKEGSVGRGLPGVLITILDPERNPVAVGEVGEVAIDGPCVMREYWQRPDATAAVMHGPWFLTGDLGRMDADGHLWIVDRMKDLIIRGGYNVYPREVEEVLYTHSAILEAAVVGLPDERLGEEVAAIVVPRAGQDIDLGELRTWLSEQLAAYKVPRVYQVVPALPKGATGKILKREISRDDLLRGGVRPPRSPVAADATITTS